MNIAETSFTAEHKDKAEYKNRPGKRHSFLSPLNQRRWQNFKANRRGFYALWIFLALCLCSLFAEFITNDRPIIAFYKGELLFPVFFDYPDEKFGGNLAAADFRDPYIAGEIAAHGWALWPPLHYSYNTPGENSRALAKPFWLQTKAERCALYPRGAADPQCRPANWNLLGTDTNVLLEMQIDFVSIRHFQ